MKTFQSTGIVYGKLWGGGFGAYPARKLQAKTKAGLLRKAIKNLNDGGLDSGMGFEYLKGALLDIEIITTIEKGSEEYSRSDYEYEFIGKLTPKEQEFLMETNLDTR